MVLVYDLTAMDTLTRGYIIVDKVTAACADDMQPYANRIPVPF